MSAGTPYSKRYGGGFLDKPTLTTPIDAQFLNAVETALLQLIGAAPTADAQVMQWDNANTRFGPALLLNKNIDPAAAISKSKLDFTGANGIVDADVAGAAGIQRSKLNFGSGLVDADIATTAAIAASKIGRGYTPGKISVSSLAGGPPGSPSDGDIWIATGVTAQSRRWILQYDVSVGDAYKWRFIGGAPIRAGNAAGSNSVNSTVQNTGGISLAITRAGHYFVTVDVQVSVNAGWNIGVGVGIAASTYLKKRDFSLSGSNMLGTTMLTLDTEFETAALAASSTLYLNTDTNSTTNSSISGGALTVIPVRIA